MNSRPTLALQCDYAQGCAGSLLSKRDSAPRTPHAVAGAANRPRRPHARRARGIALLVALFVVALVTVLVAGLLDRRGVATARAQAVHRGAQADALVAGLEAFAIAQLRRDRLTDTGRDTRADAWAQPLPATPVQGGSISGELVERNGCFNLNNLVRDGVAQPLWRRRFVQLLLVLELDPAIADSAVDWLDRGGDVEPRGAEDPAYAALKPPYRTADGPFVDISELRLLRGVDADAYATLLPHVCVLPGPTPLNINMATLEIVRALGAERPLDLASAREITREGYANYGSIEEVNAAAEGAGLPPFTLDLTDVGVRSDWFEARARVQLDDIVIDYTSLIERPSARDGRYRVVRRWRG